MADDIFTLSDRDDLSDVSDEEQPEPQLQASKRKRDTPTTTKSKKRRRLEDDDESGSDSRAGELKDDALDSEFEFDLGLDNETGTIEAFDGWGESLSTKARAEKKGVDIDAIIQRRVPDQEGGQPEHAPNSSPVDIAEGNQTDDDVGTDEGSDDHEEITFDNDELLVDELPQQMSDDTSDNQDEDDTNADVSDSDSVASPAAHPDDDVASEQSGLESDDSASAANSAKHTKFFASDGVNAGDPKATSFQEFNLSRPILRGLTTLNFLDPTPIQTRTIPVALQGLDVVGSAVTGSGKTAAFLLPILERLIFRPRKVPTTRVVIFLPTRELALQCYNVAISLARFTDITFAMLVGGFSLKEQEATIKKRPDVVVATPGRFIDIFRNSASFSIDHIEILVLDEADRMLETGFEDELKEILSILPRSRQTMLFSATMTESVDKLVTLGMNRPVRISVDAKRATTTGLTQEFIRLRPGREDKRLATVCVLCTTAFTDRVIIFCNEKKEAHHVRIWLGLLGLSAGELHGNMSQEQRVKAVNSFRDGKTSYLVATDVAARGLDIRNIKTVINYDAPRSHDMYLHRVGRTARAGKSGRSCTIAAEPDRKVVKAAVKSARAQGAKIVSRIMDMDEVNQMDQRLKSETTKFEAVLKEEKEEKAMLQANQELLRGENLMKHKDEILARPKRTWFETERDKQDSKRRAAAEITNGNVTVKIKQDKKKLSNKDKKRLDAKRDRKEGNESKLGKKALVKKGDEFRNRKVKKAKKKGKGKGR